MAWKGIDIHKDVEVLKKLHPKGDVYFLRVAVFGGLLLIVQVLYQISTAIGLIS
jgi:hypothetical protein